MRPKRALPTCAAICVGGYLNPPDNAVVLCVDEKTQIQALERTQPILPLGLGCSEGVTHDYIRHGATTLFAALDIANGQMIAQCRQRHRHQEFLSFLQHVAAVIPADLDAHLVRTTTGPTSIRRCGPGLRLDPASMPTTR